MSGFPRRRCACTPNKSTLPAAVHSKHHQQHIYSSFSSSNQWAAPQAPQTHAPNGNRSMRGRRAPRVFPSFCGQIPQQQVRPGGLDGGVGLPMCDLSLSPAPETAAPPPLVRREHTALASRPPPNAQRGD